MKLKYKETIFGYPSNLTYMDESILATFYWRLSHVPKYIPRSRANIWQYQNITKDSEQSLIFDYTNYSYPVKIHVINLHELKFSIVVNSEYVFGATQGVIFSESNSSSIFNRLLKVKYVKLGGNGMIFIAYNNDKQFEKLELTKGEDIILNQNKLIAWTLDMNKNTNKELPKGYRSFNGPGTLYFYK